MPRKTTSPKQAGELRLVPFRLGDGTYEIDPDRHKVYRKFVEIETSKAVEIFSLWRSGKVET